MITCRPGVLGYSSPLSICRELAGVTDDLAMRSLVGPRRALEFAAAERLPRADAIELQDLCLGDLLVSSTR